MRVECDICGLKANLRQDGNVGAHGYIQHGRRVSCKASGTPYAKHRAEIKAVTRGADGKATKWRADCRCGDVWTGPDFADVNAEFDRHLAEVGPS